MIILTIVFVLLGLLLVVASIDSIKKLKRMQMEFVPVVGTVVDVKEYRAYHSGSSSNGGYSYIPTVSFDFRGVNVTQQVNVETRSKRYVVGQRVAVRVNPMNPYEYYLEGDKTEGGYIFTIVLGLIFALMGIVFGFAFR